MRDNKLSDNEIIKALECCFTNDDCSLCPLFRKCPTSFKLEQYALSLINRQQAEIERLQAECYQQYAEAIKEFAERLKEKGMLVTGGRGFEGVYVMCSNIVIDNLVKEMVGDTE